MTQQEMIEQSVRMTIGDLTVQIIVLKARVSELEQQQQAAELEKTKANGKDKSKPIEARPEGG